MFAEGLDPGIVDAGVLNTCLLLIGRWRQSLVEGFGRDVAAQIGWMEPANMEVRVDLPFAGEVELVRHFTNFLRDGKGALRRKERAFLRRSLYHDLVSNLKVSDEVFLLLGLPRSRIRTLELKSR